MGTGKGAMISVLALIVALLALIRPTIKRTPINPTEVPGALLVKGLRAGAARLKRAGAEGRSGTEGTV
jgi:hypothetical protein